MIENYPPVGFHFVVSFGGLDSSSDDSRFSEVSGISQEFGREEIVEGGENRFRHKLPLPVKYQNLVLKRGLLTNSAVIGWIKNSLNNFDIHPIDLTVSLLNEKHEPLQTFGFVNAYPVKWSVSDFNASENSIVVESIEFAYQYFKKV